MPICSEPRSRISARKRRIGARSLHETQKTAGEHDMHLFWRNKWEMSAWPSAERKIAPKGVKPSKKEQKQGFFRLSLGKMPVFRRFFDVIWQLTLEKALFYALSMTNNLCVCGFHCLFVFLGSHRRVFVRYVARIRAFFRGNTEWLFRRERYVSANVDVSSRFTATLSELFSVDTLLLWLYYL